MTVNFQIAKLPNTFHQKNGALTYLEKLTKLEAGTLRPHMNLNDKEYLDLFNNFATYIKINPDKAYKLKRVIRMLFNNDNKTFCRAVVQYEGYSRKLELRLLRYDMAVLVESYTADKVDLQDVFHKNREAIHNLLNHHNLPDNNIMIRNDQSIHNNIIHNNEPLDNRRSDLPNSRDNCIELPRDVDEILKIKPKTVVNFSTPAYIDLFRKFHLYRGDKRNLKQVSKILFKNHPEAFCKAVDQFKDYHQNLALMRLRYDMGLWVDRYAANKIDLQVIFRNNRETMRNLSKQHNLPDNNIMIMNDQSINNTIIHNNEPLDNRRSDLLNSRKNRIELPRDIDEILKIKPGTRLTFCVQSFVDIFDEFRLYSGDVRNLEMVLNVLFGWDPKNFCIAVDRFTGYQKHKELIPLRRKMGEMVNRYEKDGFEKDDFTANKAGSKNAWQTNLKDAFRRNRETLRSLSKQHNRPDNNSMISSSKKFPQKEEPSELGPDQRSGKSMKSAVNQKQLLKRSQKSERREAPQNNIAHNNVDAKGNEVKLILSKNRTKLTVAVKENSIRLRNKKSFFKRIAKKMSVPLIKSKTITLRGDYSATELNNLFRLHLENSSKNNANSFLKALQSKSKIELFNLYSEDSSVKPLVNTKENLHQNQLDTLHEQKLEETRRELEKTRRELDKTRRELHETKLKLLKDENELESEKPIISRFYSEKRTIEHPGEEKTLNPSAPQLPLYPVLNRMKEGEKGSSLDDKVTREYPEKIGGIQGENISNIIENGGNQLPEPGAPMQSSLNLLTDYHGENGLSFTQEVVNQTNEDDESKETLETIELNEAQEKIDRSLLKTHQRQAVVVENSQDEKAVSVKHKKRPKKKKITALVE